MHRITWWQHDSGDTVQVSVACLDDDWDVKVVVTEHIGPFDDPDEVLSNAVREAHRLGGWRAHQGRLFDDAPAPAPLGSPADDLQP